MHKLDASCACAHKAFTLLQRARALHVLTSLMFAARSAAVSSARPPGGWNAGNACEGETLDALPPPIPESAPPLLPPPASPNRSSEGEALLATVAGTLRLAISDCCAEICVEICAKIVGVFNVEAGEVDGSFVLSCVWG